MPDTLRPEPPSVLGDQDVLSKIIVFLSSTTTYLATAPSLSDLAAPLTDISHVVFFNRGFYRRNSGTGSLAQHRLRWRVGPDVDEEVVAGFGFALEGDPGYVTQTGSVATQPNGSPWTLAAINALEDVGSAIDWINSSGVQSVHLSEVWADVHPVVAPLAGARRDPIPRYFRSELLRRSGHDIACPRCHRRPCRCGH